MWPRGSDSHLQVTRAAEKDWLTCPFFFVVVGRSFAQKLTARSSLASSFGQVV